MLRLVLLVFLAGIFVVSLASSQQKQRQPSSAGVQVVEVQDQGQIVIWEDKVAPHFRPTPGNVRNYLQSIAKARQSFLDYKISDYQLTSAKRKSELRFSGTYRLSNKTIRFSELQIFEMTGFSQYTFTIEDNGSYDDAKSFRILDKTAETN